MMNKRGVGESNLGKILLVLFFVGILLFLLTYYVLIPWLGQKDVIACGNSVVGKGTCKDVCSNDETVKVKGYGCPPEDNDAAVWCCINPDYKSEDVGGNNDYRFDVFDVGLDPSQITSGKCKEEKSWTYRCTSGTGIKIKMSVTNTGNFPLDIFANPKVGEAYPKQGQAINVKAGDTKVLAVDLNLEAKKSYVIKGAAKCNAGACKTNFGDQGIFKLNDDQYITVIIN